MRIKPRQTLAILLSMILLLALAPAGFAVDLTKGNTVTVTLATPESGYATDLKGTRVQSDFYLLAEADAIQNVDSYTYKLPGNQDSDLYKLVDKLIQELNGTDSEESEAEGSEKPTPTPPTQEAVFRQFEPYAQDFAGIVLSSDYTAQPISGNIVVDQTTITVSELPAGLYLLVIHGYDLQKTEDSETGYIKRAEQTSNTEETSNEEGSEPKSVLTTRVVTKNNEYLFRPQLLTVPTKLDDNVQQYNTAYGDWVNQLSIYAKPTQVPKNSELKIIKKLSAKGPDPVSFVFYVEWKGPDNKTVRKVVTLLFDGSDVEKYAVVKDIPIGAEVMVTEVHTGIAYKLSETSPNPPEVTIEAMPPIPEGSSVNPDELIPNANVVTFINDHSGPGGGYGLLNRFTVSGSGDFSGAQYEDSADAGNS
ncbi:MAG: hypothetical protein IKS55_04665 [Oscillospiraceae bacterium]|nr:hypothetical protein [Oscillospiraceae bacterium]